MGAKRPQTAYAPNVRFPPIAAVAASTAVNRGIQPFAPTQTDPLTAPGIGLEPVTGAFAGTTDWHRLFQSRCNHSGQLSPTTTAMRRAPGNARRGSVVAPPHIPHRTTHAP